MDEEVDCIEINSKKIRNWAIFIVIFGGIITLVVWGFSSMPMNSLVIGPLGSVHEHADFKVYINGELLNFALPKYMVKVQYVHIEDMNGVTVHKHASGVTIGNFFESLGFEFDKECFIRDTGDKFCNERDKILKFYVNGQQNYDYGNYEIRDEDKYLISYGNEAESIIQMQLDSIISS